MSACVSVWVSSCVCMFNRFVSISNGYECCKVILFNSIQKVDSTRRQKQTNTKPPRNNHETTKKERRKVEFKPNKMSLELFPQLVLRLSLVCWSLRGGEELQRYSFTTCSQYTPSLEHGLQNVTTPSCKNRIVHYRDLFLHRQCKRTPNDLPF